MPRANTASQSLERAFKDSKDLYAPLRLIACKKAPLPSKAFRLVLAWQGQNESFMGLQKTRTAPKIVQEGMWQLSALGQKKPGIKLLLIVPYLSKTIQSMIAPTQLSVIDLNGNFYIQTKKWLAIRTDRPNRFKEPTAIKKIYSGNSSIVGRLLLMENKNYASVTDVFKAIEKKKQKNAAPLITLPTVSKVLKQLEEDLIIEKTQGRIRLLQAGALLDRLREAYQAPRIGNTLKLKIPDGQQKWLDTFKAFSSFTGESSIDRYAVTTLPTTRSLYTKDLDKVSKDLALRDYIEERFPNWIILETQSDYVYFKDNNQNDLWASPVQCYLELSQLDKREKELSEQVRRAILEKFE